MAFVGFLGSSSLVLYSLVPGFLVCTKFSARNRIMELTELNHQLRRAQGKAESVARSHQEAADATRAELEIVQGRLRAMPKRFTESRQSLEREVRILEDQRRSLQLAQRKIMEVVDHGRSDDESYYLGGQLRDKSFLQWLYL